MTTEQKASILEARLTKLSGSPKNIKCPGVVRKLRRQYRNLTK